MSAGRACAGSHVFGESLAQFLKVRVFAVGLARAAADEQLLQLRALKDGASSPDKGNREASRVDVCWLVRSTRQASLSDCFREPSPSTSSARPITV